MIIPIYECASHQKEYDAVHDNNSADTEVWEMLTMQFSPCTKSIISPQLQHLAIGKFSQFSPFKIVTTQ